MKRFVSRMASGLMLTATVAACDTAKASQYDSADPVHCLTIFGATSGTVRSGPLADELNARILYIIHSNGGEKWLREVTPVSRKIGARWEASKEWSQAIAHFEECRRRQNADPEFTAKLPELLREGARISSTAY